MICAGMDVSGKSQIGHYVYMSIVLGVNDSINQLANRLGYKHIHMRSIKNKREKLDIISKMNFNNMDFLVLCIRMDRDVIINEFTNSKKNWSRFSESKLVRIFNCQLFKLVRKDIESFLSRHRSGLSEIVFQTDVDCRDFAKNNGLRYADPNKAHMLADIVAFANNISEDIGCAKDLDLRDPIRESMKKQLKRKM